MKRFQILIFAIPFLIGCSNSLNEEDKERLKPIVENAFVDVPVEMEKVLKAMEAMERETQRISAGNASFGSITSALQKHQNVIAQANEKIASKCIAAAEKDKQLSRLFIDVAKTISGEKIAVQTINYANKKFHDELFARLNINSDKFYSWAEEYKGTTGYRKLFEN